MKSCNEIKDMMSQYIDRELNSKSLDEFQNHIQSCEECRIELQELEQIINMCGSIAEEELPTDFKQQLHEKLLMANEGSETKVVEADFGNRLKMRKYIRIGTSVAAVILIAVMLKVLFPMSGVYEKSTESSPADQSAENATIVQSAESKAEYGDVSSSMVAKDQYGTTSENDLYITEESAESEKETAKGSMKKAETPSVGGAPAQRSTPKAKAAPEESKENTADIAAPEQSAMFSIQTTATSVIRDTDITVRVENPEKEVDKLKSKALEYEAEFIEMRTMSGVGGSDNKDENGDNTLVFRMPYARYNDFVQALKNSWGEKSVVAGATNAISMDEQIKGYEARLTELNSKISIMEEAGTANDDEELMKLKTERESVQKDLEYLMRDTQFISVCIQVLDK